MIGTYNSGDRFIVDNVGDVVQDAYVWGWDEGRDIVASSISYVLPYFIEDLELTGSAAINGTGNVKANRLNGATNSAANVLAGGLGDDIYVLGAGDTIIENAGEGQDSLEVSAPAANPENVWTLDGLLNIEGLLAAEGAGNVTLLGNAATTCSPATRWRTCSSAVLAMIGSWVEAGTTTTSASVRAAAVMSSPTARARTSLPCSETESIDPELLGFARVGDDLKITISATSSVTVESWFEDSANRIAGLRLYENGIEYGYNAAQMEARANGVNLAPVVGFSLPSGVSTETGAAFSFQFGANAFLDLESQHSLVYSVTLADGSPLPGWLSFNAATRTLSGTPSAANLGALGLNINATDAGGLTGTASFSVTVEPAAIVGTEGNDVLTGDDGHNIIIGLGGNDTIDGAGDSDDLFGDEGNDTIQGGAGNDFLYGGDGNDTLDGGSGVDNLDGGLGNDTYILDSASDHLREAAGEGTDEIRTNFTVTMSTGTYGEIENLTLLGTAALSALGNSLGNVMNGNSGSNTLWGDAGNDTLWGGSGGSDSLRGEAGDDIYIVDRTSGISIFEVAGEGIEQKCARPSTTR